MQKHTRSIQAWLLVNLDIGYSRKLNAFILLFVALSQRKVTARALRGGQTTLRSAITFKPI